MPELTVNARLYFAGTEAADDLLKVIDFCKGQTPWDQLPKKLQKAQARKLESLYRELKLCDLEGSHTGKGLVIVSSFGSSNDDPLPIYKLLGKYSAECSYLEYSFDGREYFQKHLLIGARPAKVKDFYNKVLSLDPQLALELAVAENYIGEVKKRAKSGMNLDRHIQGRTPLHHAFTGIDRLVVQDILIASGADPNIGALDAEGHTPIFHAVTYTCGHYDDSNTRFSHTELYKRVRDDPEAFCLERLEVLIGKGADVNVRARNGSTPLMHAARLGRARLCRRLLEAGADANALDNEGVSALLVAASLREPATAKRTLEVLLEFGGDLRIRDNKGKGAMDQACGNPAVETFLIERGLSLADITKWTAWPGDYPLDKQVWHLVYRADFDRLLSQEFLSRVAADADALRELYETIGKFGRTRLLSDLLGSSAYDERLLMEACLVEAASSGALETIERCLDLVGDPYAYMPAMTSALFRTASRTVEDNAEACAHRLLDSVDFTKRPAMEPKREADFLRNVLSKFSVESIKRILPLGREHLSARGGAYGRHELLVHEMLADYLDPFPSSYLGEYLLWASGPFSPEMNDQDRIELVRICDLALRKGADAQMETTDGDPMLIVAAMQGIKGLVERLLACGVPVDIPNRFGRTALSFAAGRGYLGIVECLLANGADPSIKDRRGFLPYSYAKGQKHEEIMALLNAAASGDA